MFNLANLNQDQGNYSEAEPLYEEALRVRKQQLGNDHPAVTATFVKDRDLVYRSRAKAYTHTHTGPGGAQKL